MEYKIFDWLENPEVFKINRLDAHSDHTFYETYEDMENENKTLFHSLNGNWKFKWSKNLNERPVDFYKMDYSLVSFDTIPVPSHMELNGYDHCKYVNVMYPWDGWVSLKPPFVDKEYNPVGSYVTFFDLPENFANKTVCISMQGVEQGFSIFLNGEFVGYAEDTFTPSDFDLTKFVKEKDNKLAVEVYKKTSSAWIEDQDFFRFSGIFRDVILYAKPECHVEDLWVKPEVCDDLKSADFSFKIKTNCDKPNIKFELFDKNNNSVLSHTPELEYKENPTIEPSENADAYHITPRYRLENVDLWDLGKPNLYNLIITVMDSNGNTTEVISQDVGFRKFCVEGKVLKLNGERLKIKGVNRHEWSPSKGRAIDASDMIADMEVFKKNNIKCTRTSHYPNQSLWYQLCDRNGVMMVDETNLESHGSPSIMTVPASLPEWRSNVIDRAVNMFERDKNHPAILFWSCGNESHEGECILAMADYFRRKDDSRCVHYEGCAHGGQFGNSTDVYSKMYTQPGGVAAAIEGGVDKPAMLVEYMHNMGNSNGGMESYMKLFDKYESYHGGFIWDYMDQALYFDKNGKKALGYGGDFEDRPTDYNFSGNGIVFADRSEKPAMQEVKFWYGSDEDRDAHIAANEKKIAELKPAPVVPKVKPFTISRGVDNIGITGEGFKIMLSKLEGGITSIVYDDYEWIYRASRPTYWRAPTENDIGCGFPKRSGQWGYVDAYSRYTKLDINTDVENEITVKFEYDTLIGTTTDVTYTIYSDGTIKVNSKLNGKEGLPQLPLFGMRFITPKKVDKFEYVGYSGETYPDRYKGGTFGVHTSDVVTADYLVPQENGCHSYSHSVKLMAGNNKSLEFVMSKSPFHFSVLNNTAAELENALHKDELPDTGRSVVCILSEMRGVGGIDSWGTDIEKEYHIHADKDLEVEFFIRRK